MPRKRAGMIRRVANSTNGGPLRPQADLETAERLLLKLGGRLSGGGRMGPTRRAILRAAVMRSTSETPGDATARQVAEVLAGNSPARQNFRSRSR